MNRKTRNLLKSVENLLAEIQGEFLLLVTFPPHCRQFFQSTSDQGEIFLSKHPKLFEDFIQHCHEKLDSLPGFAKENDEKNEDSKDEEKLSAMTYTAQSKLEVEKSKKDGEHDILHKSTLVTVKDENEAEMEANSEDSYGYVSNGSDEEFLTKGKRRKFVKPVNKSDSKRQQTKDIKENKNKKRVKHVKNGSQKSVKKFKCNSCGETFRREFYLKKHIDTRKCKQNVCISQDDGNHDQPDTSTCQGKSLHFTEKCDATELNDLVKNEDGDILICTSCNQKFTTVENLAEHKKNICDNLCSKYLDSDQYTQGNCSKTEEGVLHLNEIENCQINRSEYKIKQKKGIECPVCFVMIGKEYDLMLHLESHEPKLTQTCQHCSITFTQDHDLLAHIMTAHLGSTNIHCTTCKGLFTSQKSLANHSCSKDADEDTFIPPYICPNCMKEFKYLKTFNCHLNSCAEKRTNYCDQCNRFFKYKSNLTKHMKYTHSNARDYICDTCGKSFKHNDSLKFHQKIHVEGKKACFKCTECGQILSGASALRVHMRRHTEFCPYMCEICGKAFRQVSNLQKHSLVHTDVTRYKCDLCNKVFKYQQTYKTHMTAHILKEGPLQANKTQFSKVYTCTYCNKQVSTASQYKVHLRKHTNERPYKCDYCDKAFKEHGKKKRHMKIHTTSSQPRITPPGVPSKNLNTKGTSNQRPSVENTKTAASDNYIIIDIGGTNYISQNREVQHETYKIPQSSETQQETYNELPSSTANLHVSVIPTMQNSLSESTGVNGPVLLQMMPSSQFQSFVSPASTPVSLSQSDNVSSTNYEMQQYLRSLEYPNNAL